MPVQWEFVRGPRGVLQQAQTLRSCSKDPQNQPERWNWRGKVHWKECGHRMGIGAKGKIRRCTNLRGDSPQVLTLVDDRHSGVQWLL